MIQIHHRDDEEREELDENLNWVVITVASNIRDWLNKKRATNSNPSKEQ